MAFVSDYHSAFMQWDLWRVGKMGKMPVSTWDDWGGTPLTAQQLLLGCLLVVAVAVTARGEQVVRVKDGDSIVVSSGGRHVDVRLADIDAPEHRQPHGDAARAALRALVDDRDVRLALVGGDAYRRIVAHVFVDDIDVNAEMVRRGHAWVRRAYSPAPKLVAAEDAARGERVGLWKDASPTPPWEWRRSRRSAAKPAAEAKLPLKTIPKVQCGTKSYCREMSSCEEAVAFLRQCAVATLDGDGDGRPCETLCRGRAL